MATQPSELLASSPVVDGGVAQASVAAGEEPLTKVRNRMQTPAVGEQQRAVALAADLETRQWARAVKASRRWQMMSAAAVGGLAVLVGVGLVVSHESEPAESDLTLTPVPSSIGPAAPATEVATRKPPEVHSRGARTGPAGSGSATGNAPRAEVLPGPRSVKLEVIPARSLIFNGTRRLGKSPLTVEVAPGEKLRLLVAQDGYRPERIVVDGSQPRISLELVPYRETVLAEKKQSTAREARPAEAGAGKPAAKSRPWEPELFVPR